MNDDRERAFDAFVRSASPRLLRSAVLLTGDRGHAEDLVQVTLARIAGRFRTQDPEPLALARRTLVNLAKDRRRARARRVVETELDATGSGHLTHPDDRYEQLAERHALLSALQRLSDRQRAVLVLRFYDDLPVERVADILGCSAGTVKSTTSDALANLRRVLLAMEEKDHVLEH